MENQSMENGLWFKIGHNVVKYVEEENLPYKECAFRQEEENLAKERILLPNLATCKIVRTP